MIVARDASRSGAPIDVFRGAAPAGSELVCDANEVAVLFRDGRVLGVLGPGRAALEPGTAPFVASALTPDGSLAAAVYFVSVVPLRGIRFGGPLGGAAPSGDRRVFGDAVA